MNSLTLCFAPKVGRASKCQRPASNALVVPIGANQLAKLEVSDWMYEWNKHPARILIISIHHRDTQLAIHSWRRRRTTADAAAYWTKYPTRQQSRPHSTGSIIESAKVYLFIARRNIVNIIINAFYLNNVVSRGTAVVLLQSSSSSIKISIPCCRLAAPRRSLAHPPYRILDFVQLILLQFDMQRLVFCVPFAHLSWMKSAPCPPSLCGHITYSQSDIFPAAASDWHTVATVPAVHPHQPMRIFGLFSDSANCQTILAWSCIMGQVPSPPPPCTF